MHHHSSLDFFSHSYFDARERFRDRVHRKGGRLTSLPIDSKGPGGEDLTIDIAEFGAEQPQRVLLHSSGLHGVEGFAGSAIQLQLLNELPALPRDGGLVLTHILNPYGMAWLRRVNASNVDLNRNYLADGSYAGAPETYAQCDSFLNPKSPPSRDLFIIKAPLLILRYGFAALKQAVAGGQYEFPKGLFFGGKELQPELLKYSTFLVSKLQSAARVFAVDVHTGLGKRGEDSLLVRQEQLERMKAHFGPRVTPLDPKHGPAYEIRGDFQLLLFDLFPPGNTYFIGQEFGTFNPITNIRALREENRWHHYGAGTLEHPAKRMLKETFCPDDEAWRRAVLSRGRELVNAALSFL